MNHFKSVLEKSRKSSNSVIQNIVKKIDKQIKAYDDICLMDKMIHNFRGSDVLNSFSRGLHGEDGFSPLMYSANVPNPYQLKQELLLKITILFEILEENKDA